MQKVAAVVTVLSCLLIWVSCAKEDADTTVGSYDYAGKYVCEDVKGHIPGEGLDKDDFVIEVSESHGLYTVIITWKAFWETDRPIRTTFYDGLLDDEASFTTTAEPDDKNVFTFRDERLYWSLPDFDEIYVMVKDAKLFDRRLKDLSDQDG